MLLVLSHSEDFTTDVVLDRLPDIPLFRLNIDLWREYQWSVGGDGFSLIDPAGRECRDTATRAVYLRKLLQRPVVIDVPAGGSEEAWVRGEIELLWLGLRDWASQTGRLALVHPAPTGRWSKIRQMMVAANHFRVPEWRAVHGAQPLLAPPVVAKAFGQQLIGAGALFAVREVDTAALSPEFPWFLQCKPQDTTHDVTVAWIKGRCFAYELERASFEGDDCRFPSTMENLKWTRCELSASERTAVNTFMAETGYSFGRLDFLRAGGCLWFLELNPNGQFAWLDPRAEDGLIDAVADAIREVWEQNGADEGPG